MLFQIYVHFFLVLLLAQFCVCLDGNDSMSIFEKKWFAEESRECNKGEFEVSSIVMGCEKKDASPGGKKDYYSESEEIRFM